MGVKIRQRQLKSGETAFYLDIYRKGHRHYEATALRAKKSDRARFQQALKAAKAIAAEREREMALDEEGLVSTSKRNADFIVFMEQVAKERGANRSYQNWLAAIKHVKAFTQSVTMSAVNSHWLEGLKAHLLAAESFGQSTAHGYFSMVRTAVKEAHKRGYLRDNPVDKVSHIKKIQAKREFLEIDELERLAGTPCRNEEVARAFLFACYTGLRYGDVSQLTFGNIRGNTIIVTQEKTKEVLHLPMAAQASAIIETVRSLRPYTGEDARVFILPVLMTVERVLSRWKTDAGITKQVTFHVSRHTFATLALTYGGDIYTVSKLLGHKSVQTTQIYAKIVDSKKAATVAALPSLAAKLQSGGTFEEYK